MTDAMIEQMREEAERAERTALAGSSAPAEPLSVTENALDGGKIAERDGADNTARAPHQAHRTGGDDHG